MNADWLTQLAPAHAPAAPAWWPPAMGWWIVTALLLALLAAGIFWRRFSGGARSKRIGRVALAELNRIRSLDEAEQARALQRLMRRYALTVYGSRTVARLSGEAWLRFVASHGGAGFDGPHGAAFLAAAFGKGASTPQFDWSTAAEGFIRHRASKERAT